MSVSIAAATDSQVKTTSNDSKDVDEEVPGMSLAVSSEAASLSTPTSTVSNELVDPAILAVGPAAENSSSSVQPQFRYSRERLLELRETPLSQQRPEYLDTSYNNSRGFWDPKRWDDRKRSETPSDNGSRNETVPENHKRRSGDPRERIRKEQDGIVLSPQRRSFNSGCFVPANQTQRPARPHSPLGKSDPHIGAHRSDLPVPPGGRRIGSGRILSRDVSWDFPTTDKGLDMEPDFSFRPRERREPDRDREDGGGRFERRSFGRDFELTRDRDKERHITRNGGGGRGPPESNNNRYSSNNDRRRMNDNSRDDEPEWFSGGPTSQTDTIELRGFDDASDGDKPRKKQTAQQKKKAAKERAIIKTSGVGGERDGGGAPGKEDSPPKGGPGARSTPTPQDGTSCGPPATHSPIAEEPHLENNTGPGGGHQLPPGSNKNATDSAGEISFDIEEYLKGDTISIPGLTNGVDGDGSGGTGGSRFTRWFTRESPVKQVDSRRSSLHEEHLVKNIINELNEPNIQIPGVTDSDAYFAPISPAANTTTTKTGGSSKTSGSGRTAAANSSGPPAGDKPFTLMEMLQRAKQATPQMSTADIAPSVKSMEPGKVMSLEELEARMRQHGGAGDGPHIGRPVAGTGAGMPGITSSTGAGGGSGGGHGVPNIVSPNKQDEDMSAFKRLLAQVSGGHAIPATTQQKQPMSLLEMLNHSQQLDEARVAAQLLGTTQNTSNNLAPDVLMQIQQQQQRQKTEILSKLMNPAAATPAPPGQRQPPFGASPLNLQPDMGPSRELLQRPEAVAILQGLKRGDITPQHLYQQLHANPAMQPRHRELLLTILKLQGGGVGPSPRVLSPAPQQIMFQQQQQQQLRVSPLPPNAYCVSPILATSPNTLTVHHPAMQQQRIPSPRELQAHTQSIMQRALIKKKLEEQQENYRKKQELQRSHSPAPPGVAGGSSGASPAKHLSSPTPLAFTPTSVLRKMTADKEDVGLGGASGVKEGNKTVGASGGGVDVGLHKPQGRPLTGMRQQVVPQAQQAQPPSMQQAAAQQQQQQQWNHMGPVGGHMVIKQPGRPIVKGNYQQQNQQQQQQQHQDQYQSQMRGVSGIGALSALFQQSQLTSQSQQQRSKMPPAPQQQQQQQQSYLSRNQTLQGQLNRAQHQYNIPQRGGTGSGGGGVGSGSNALTSWQMLMEQSNYDNRGLQIGSGRGSGLHMGNRGSPMMDGVGGVSGGELSPTSNQLARWFSPELLAQARAGKLPDMPNASVASQALSLEELERIQQTAPTVHN